jgi:hypothetical protein
MIDRSKKETTPPPTAAAGGGHWSVGSQSLTHCLPLVDHRRRRVASGCDMMLAKTYPHISVVVAICWDTRVNCQVMARWIHTAHAVMAGSNCFNFDGNVKRMEKKLGGK